MPLLILVVMVALTWGLVIVPQQRRVKAHTAFVAQLEVGDAVVTTSGVYGTITRLGTDRARLLVSPGVEITVARLSIGSRQEPEPPATATDEAVGDTDHTVE